MSFFPLPFLHSFYINAPHFVQQIMERQNWNRAQDHFLQTPHFKYEGVCSGLHKQGHWQWHNGLEETHFFFCNILPVFLVKYNPVMGPVTKIKLIPSLPLKSQKSCNILLSTHEFWESWVSYLDHWEHQKSGLMGCTLQSAFLGSDPTYSTYKLSWATESSLATPSEVEGVTCPAV